ncbi:hypothetical protein [Corallibacter sp.]|uniref:hypothetical protein n=1 Tax=Corallibacter sp. TaxID=2038084 RepID=UPI003A8E4664
MKLFKFFQYAYLIFGVVFAFDAVNRYIQTETIAYTSILLAATAIFMFFFRRKFNKRFDNKD